VLPVVLSVVWGQKLMATFLVPASAMARSLGVVGGVGVGAATV